MSAARFLEDAETIERLTREVLELRRRQVPTIRRAPTTIGHGRTPDVWPAMRAYLGMTRELAREADELHAQVFALTRRLDALEREANTNGLGERG